LLLLQSRPKSIVNLSFYMLHVTLHLVAGLAYSDNGAGRINKVKLLNEPGYSTGIGYRPAWRVYHPDVTGPTIPPAHITIIIPPIFSGI